MTPLPKGLYDDRFDTPAEKTARPSRPAVQRVPSSVAPGMFIAFMIMVAQVTGA
jgi:hypothetical protein